MNNYFEMFNDTFLNSSNNMNNSANNNTTLFGPYEGYMKGNLFKNLYQPYKEYEPAQIVPNNEQEEMLLNLNQMQFAMHELNLLLDVYPNDRNMLTLFGNYQKSYNSLLQQYQERYGVLNVNDTDSSSVPFAWQNETWSWDRRGL